MSTGSSRIASLGRRGRKRLDARLRDGRKSRFRWLESESLESRTLLATAPVATGSFTSLTSLTSATAAGGGNANSPTVVIDPYDAEKMFAVWGVDESTETAPPHTDVIVQGAYSSNAGASWSALGTTVAVPQNDPLLYGSTTVPPTYTQVVDPSVAFDASHDVYVLTMQTNGSASDGALYLSEFNFQGNTPTAVSFTYNSSAPNANEIYQWVGGSDAATDPTLAVDASDPPAGTTQDPNKNNVYVAWASIDVQPANTNLYTATGFNPDRAELVVGTPNPNGPGTSNSMAFSGVKSVNVASGTTEPSMSDGPQLDASPQLVINQNDGGEVTVAWDDFGSGATASPAFDNLDSNEVAPGDSFGAASTSDGTTLVAASSASTPTWTEPTLATGGIYYAGPAGSTAIPTAVVASQNVDGVSGNDIVVADQGIGEVGVLLNQGAGAFPAPPANASTYSAGTSPTGLALGAISGYGTSVDAVAANLTGGVTILTNSGNGTYNAPVVHLEASWEAGTTAVALANLDNTGLNSIIAVDKTSSTVTIFPDGSSTANPVELTAGLSSPIAVIVGQFRGAGSNIDLLVLNSNGTIQPFINNGAFSFTAGASIAVPGAVAMTTGAIYAAGEADLVVAYNNTVTGLGAVEVLQNTSTATAITFGAAAQAGVGLPGTAVGVAVGNLSGNTTNLSDIAVLYSNNGTNTSAGVPAGESMVAVYTNQTANGAVAFTHVNPAASASDTTPEDWDAGETGPKGIAVADVSGGAIEDIVVTSSGGRGYVSVLKGSLQASGSPGTAFLNIPVTVTSPSTIDDMTVTLDMVDQASLANVEIILAAPNGAGQIVLVDSEYTAVGGTANTTVGLPNGNAIGVFGFGTGATGAHGFSVGTIFDDNATRDIFDPTTANPVTNGNTATDYIGYFRPEGGSLDNLLKTIGSANINGTWILEIKDYATAVTSVPNQGQVYNVSLQFTSAMTAGAPTRIASTYIRGGIGTQFAYAASGGPTAKGVGPGLVLAIDNTVGTPFTETGGTVVDPTPYQGRIYAAFVDLPANPSSITVQAGDSDVELYYSTNGGSTWVASVNNAVNDDDGLTDGYSGEGVIAGTEAYGRTQFQPEIAVDQATGTVVLSWRDARNDASDERVATYLTYSEDGGDDFSSQTYANPSATAVDAITGATDILGPEPDNESAGNPQTDATFGFGDQMGLAVYDGVIYPMWAGNLNETTDPSGTIITNPLNIDLQRMVIPAGPQIVDSTMGAITYSMATGVPVGQTPVGTSDSIVIDFDRPVTVSSFAWNVDSSGPPDVEVFFKGTSGTSSFIALTVTGISALNQTTSLDGDTYYATATEFIATFNTTPLGENPATWDYTGTYSYLVMPDNGDGLAISAPIEATVATPSSTTLRTDDPDDQNVDPTLKNGQSQFDLNAVTTEVTGAMPGDVYTVPAVNPAATTTVWGGSTSALAVGASPVLAPPDGFDENTLPILVPGPQVLSTSAGGSSNGGNLILDGTTSSVAVNFDRPIQVSSFTAGQVLQIMGPTGSVSGVQAFPSDEDSLGIQPATGATTPSTLTSTLTIPSYGGTFTIADISVELTIAMAPDSALSATLVAPDGQTITLFQNVGGSGSDFTDTILEDSAGSSIDGGSAPFVGSYQPAQSLLATLGNMPVDGVWKLLVSNSSTTATGTLDSWSLNITPVIAVNAVVSSESDGGARATQFTVSFPRQQLSGTYTLQFGSTIEDQFGNGLDPNQDAGLAVLRGENTSGETTTVHYTTSAVPQPISGATTTSTITVPDNFFIQGDKAPDGASNIQVQLNISYPSDPDLTATLTHETLAGVPIGQPVILFSGVGAGTTSANFDDTVLDDNAATPIQLGAAPFFSTYNPQESLATQFASGPAGQSVQGYWVLTITNGSSSGTTGTLNSWSMSFQQPVLSTSLDQPSSGEDASATFQIFTLAQSDALSSEAWTAVGPASIGSEGSVSNGGTTGDSTGGDPSGRVSGIAVDPSDPSGNTVYAAGASGGVWKTTDFLTPTGEPNWIPLTNFGPTDAVNIGAIAVFGRNNDPNQSIIVAATGEGDTAAEGVVGGGPGVGFLISTDGGATWNLYDSSDNVDGNGNLLPIDSPDRNRIFVGDSAFAVVVDPRPTPSGGVIIYAALSGPTGGIWRSEDTGQTWTQVLAGQATDVVLDPDSDLVLDPSTNTFVPGNDQLLYAAIQGQGVYMSPNQGQVWDEMLGGIGNPLIFNTEPGAPLPNVNPTNGPTPNGAEGRISLAIPAATGIDAEDDVYEGWLYAMVATPGGTLFGLFVTKDFGENWTEIQIPTAASTATTAIPDDNPGSSEYQPITTQADYDQVITVDPDDPNVVYMGGTIDGKATSALTRIDITDIWDAHSLVASDNAVGGVGLTSTESDDAGTVSLSGTGPATITDKTKIPSTPYGSDAYLNFIRNPEEPFDTDSTLVVYDYSSFVNSGGGVTWIPMDVGETMGTDYHRMIAMVDPTTGLSRLIIGDDQGIWTWLDDYTPANRDTTAEASVGLPAQATDVFASGSRNGNLQITQFYYGAAQPSTLAAEIANSLFYGSAQDNGAPSSAGNVLTSGNIVWDGPGGDSSGVATDQQGNGTYYQYFWPCCGGGDTDFFQVDGVGSTYGLLQASDGDPTPDPQWPQTGPAPAPQTGGTNFAVNPVNGQDIVISSFTGNIFTTTNGGTNWFDVGAPSVFGSPGSFDLALAYGAPDPTAPEGVGNLGNFIYVGTQTGQIYVTQDGGGSGNSNNWISVSAGLDGSSIKQIITDPTRGSHDAYAVTENGVYYIANSVPSATNPNPTWVNITGGLKTLAYSIFGAAYNPATDANAKPYDQALTLSSIAADWRYAIPNDASDPSQGYHPVLYVGADSAVFVSYDQGQTWNLFPETLYGGVAAGGDLPHVEISSLSLSLGDINPQTGMGALGGPDNPYSDPFTGTLAIGSKTVANVSNTTGLQVGFTITSSGGDIPAGTTITAITSNTITLSAAPTVGGTAVSLAAADLLADPDLLSAATYGQGTYAINLPPEIVGNSVSVTGESAATSFTDTLPAVTGPLTLSGTSEITNFGDATWITVEDVTNPANPVVVAGFAPGTGSASTPGAGNSTNTLGAFSIAFNPETYYGAGASGIKTLEIFATDNAGSSGQPVTLTFYLNPPYKVVFASEPPATATAGQNFAASPNVVVDVEDSLGNIVDNFNGLVTLSLANNTTATFVGTLALDANDGVATFSQLQIDTAGTYELDATATNLASGDSTPITITPAAASKISWSVEPPSTVTEGVSFSGTVQIQDQYGNLEATASSTVTLSLDFKGQPDATDLGGTITMTTSGGSATFSDIVINNIGQPYTLSASSSGSGLTAAVSTAIDSVPPTLVPSDPPSQIAGASFPLTWKALTNTGAVDTAFDGTVVLSILSGPAGAQIQGTTSETAVQGVATFPAVILDTAGSYVIQASSGNLTPGDNDVTVVAAAAAGLWITQQPPSVVTAGAGFNFQVVAVDRYGNQTALTGVITATLSTDPGGTTLGGTTTVSAAGGVATFSGLTLDVAGSGYVIQVSTNGLSSATTTPITVTPATVDQFVIPADGEPPASVDAGQTFSPAFIVEAEDQYGNIVTGYSGPFDITSPAGVQGTNDVTVANGVATFANLSIDTVGSYQLIATNGSTISVTSTLVNVVVNPQASEIGWKTEPPGQVVVGDGFGATVQVEDAYGNVEPTYDGDVTIMLGTNPDGATLGGTLTVAAVDGVATFTGLTLNEVDSGYTLEATTPAIGGYVSLPSTPIQVTAVLPSGLAIANPLQPQTVMAGGTFSVTVDVNDQSGVPDPEFDGTVTLALATPNGGVTLQGTTSEAAQDGVATFSGLSIDSLGIFAIQASVASTYNLNSALSPSVTVVAGTATQLVVHQQVQSTVTAGQSFDMAVEAEDAYGNEATSFNGTLTAALTPSTANGAALGGDVTATVVNGIASFSGLALVKEGGGYTITVTGTGVTAAVSDPFSVIASSPPTQLIISSAPPTSVTAGVPFSLKIGVADAYGNVDTAYSGPITIKLLGGTLSGTLTATASAGVASFQNLSLLTAATGDTIQATGTGGLLPVTTGPMTVTAAAPSQLLVLVPPPTQVLAGAQFGMSVVAEDAYGNRATQFSGSVTIGLSSDPGGAPLSGGPFTVTASGGVANFPANGLALDTAASGYKLQATSGTLAPATSAPINVSPGVATHLAVVSEPPSVLLIGGTFGMVVAAEDSYGNIDPTFDGKVTVAAPAGSGATLTGTTSVAAVDGVATYAGLGLSQASAAVALPVTTTGLSGTTTSPVTLTSPPVFSLVLPSSTVNENAGSATIQVVRTGGYQGATSVQIVTSGGSAVPGVNYTPVNQTLNFAAGQSSQTVTIPILNAGTLSSNPTVGIVLNNPAGGQATASLQILSTDQSASPVSVEDVMVIRNKRHQVTDIVVTFTGGLDAADAQNIAEYTVIQAGRKNSFTGKGAKALKLRSAAYNGSNDTVTITPRKKFVITAKPVEVTIDGTSPSGLRDSQGNFLAGNGVAVLTKKSGTVSAASTVSAAVDQIVELGGPKALVKGRRP